MYSFDILTFEGLEIICFDIKAKHIMFLKSALTFCFLQILWNKTKKMNK